MALMALIVTLSIAMVVASILLAPYCLVRLPADYFQREKPHLGERLKAASTRKALLLILKNVAGMAILVAGVAMLVLPGQGMFTILVALFLIDFPGKFTLERWVVSRPSVAKSINWLREKAHRPPFEI